MELNENQIKWLNKRLVQLNKQMKSDDNEGFDGLMIYSDYASARTIALLNSYAVDTDGRMFKKKTVDGKEVRTYVS